MVGNMKRTSHPDSSGFRDAVSYKHEVKNPLLISATDIAEKQKEIWSLNMLCPFVLLPLVQVSLEIELAGSPYNAGAPSGTV